jgi:predicted MPP superfamily phosphohydrolase
VLGVDDPGDRWADRDYESEALEALVRAAPEDAPRILLAHRPSYFRQAARLGLPLMLAGHTHGGQITLPGRARHFNISRMIARWTRGRFEQGESILYVNRGLGVAGPPVRLNCPRDIAVLKLVPRRA